MVIGYLVVLGLSWRRKGSYQRITSHLPGGYKVCYRSKHNLGADLAFRLLDRALGHDIPGPVLRNDPAGSNAQTEPGQQKREQRQGSDFEFLA